MFRLYSIRFQALALLFACNYFAFRTELFRDEYESNHPQSYGTGSITVNGTNWETFDKDNATKAFVVIPSSPVIVVWYDSSEKIIAFPVFQPIHPVRDKSPPGFS